MDSCAEIRLSINQNLQRGSQLLGLTPCSSLHRALPDFPPCGQSPCRSVNMWKMPPFLWFWAVRSESFQRNSERGASCGATDLFSARFPSLPVAHERWCFRKENKGAVGAKERPRGLEAALARRCPAPGAPLPTPASFTIECIRRQTASSRHLWRTGFTAAHVLLVVGASGTFTEC